MLGVIEYKNKVLVLSKKEDSNIKDFINEVKQKAISMNSNYFIVLERYGLVSLREIIDKNLDEANKILEGK